MYVFRGVSINDSLILSLRSLRPLRLSVSHK